MLDSVREDSVERFRTMRFLGCQDTNPIAFSSSFYKAVLLAGKSLFRTLARAQITGRTAGMLKLLFHRETLELLGIHCFGENASEIIHIGQAIMVQPPPNNTLKYFVNTTFNYPTMAEAYRVAALNGLDQL